MKKKLFPLFLLLFFTGCTGTIQENISLPEIEPVSMVTNPPKKEEYSLYYQSPNYIVSTYEPDAGCYLGAYVLSNKQINFDMDSFDRITEKSHGIYMYSMSLRDFFPTTWILSCVSSMKTPYIVLNPPNEYHPFDKELIDMAAQSFGELYIPMFVEFYPDPQAALYDPEEYIEFFRYARMVFNERASNVAFVWAVDESNVMGSSAYYPGDRYADWVGLHIYDTISDGQYKPDVFNSIDYFYNSFQNKKPIAVSQLAVSHYSSSDHIYRTTEAADEISRIYNRLAADYPRVKLINYMDFNGLEISSDKKVRDNFIITEMDGVLDAYRSAAADPHYLTELTVSAAGSISSQLIRSPFTVYKIGDIFYVSEKSFSYDLNMHGLTNGMKINGESFYDLSIIEKNDIGFVVEDQENKKITIMN